MSNNLLHTQSSPNEWSQQTEQLLCFAEEVGDAVLRNGLFFPCLRLRLDGTHSLGIHLLECKVVQQEAQTGVLLEHLDESGILRVIAPPHHPPLFVFHLHFPSFPSAFLPDSPRIAPIRHISRLDIRLLCSSSPQIALL